MGAWVNVGLASVFDVEARSRARARHEVIAERSPFGPVGPVRDELSAGLHERRVGRPVEEDVNRSRR